MYEIPKFTATPEQIEYADEAIKRSLKCDFKNYLEPFAQQGEKSQNWRFYGFLGEVLFADAYGLPRPLESFGLHGQDNGVDFIINGYKIDIKTAKLRGVPISVNQLFFKPNARVIGNPSTDYYYFIGIHEFKGVYTAYLAGAALSKDIRDGKVGSVSKKGDEMPGGITREYDSILLTPKDFIPIKINPDLQKQPNFQIIKLY